MTSFFDGIGNDIFIGLFIIIVTVLLTLWRRSASAALILSFFPAMLLYIHIPEEIENIFKNVNDAFMFAILFCFCFFIIYNSLNDFFSKKLKGTLLEGVILGIGVVILLLTITYHFVSLSDLVVVQENELVNLISVSEHIFYILLIPLVLFFVAFFI